MKFSEPTYDRLEQNTQEQALAHIEGAVRELKQAGSGRALALARASLRLRQRWRGEAGPDRFDPIGILLQPLLTAHRQLAQHGPSAAAIQATLQLVRQRLQAIEAHRLYPAFLRLIGLGNGNAHAFQRALVQLKAAEALLKSAGAPDAAATIYSTAPSLSDAVELQPLLGNGVEEQLTIIVPVYGGRFETISCLLSVLSARNVIIPRLLVINDQSPDQALVSDLAHLAERGLFELQHNQTNSGFVSTVNRGILAASGDIVLLNSDTLVSDGWLDELHVAAAARPDAGSISPLSNNATILSYPSTNRFNPLPKRTDLTRLARLAALETLQPVIEVPTTVGFCMYITREALDQVGLFNEPLFGLGYGEESEWCMRARDLGYRHYLATRAFVYHHGSVSFSEKAVERQLQAGAVMQIRHPQYWPLVSAHVASDPVARVRRRLDEHRTIDAHSTTPTILHVLHSIGGGTEGHVRELAEILKDEVGVFSLTLQPDGAGRVLISSNVINDVPNLLFHAETDRAELHDFMLRLNVIRIHVHHVIGYDHQFIKHLARGLGKQITFTLHDFFYVCPQFVLLNHRGSFCDLPPSVECNRCIAAKPPPVSSPSIADWRHGWKDLLDSAEQVIAPSHACASLHRRIWPDLAITVLEHPEKYYDNVGQPTLVSSSNLRTIAIIGTISDHKGRGILEACLKDAQERHLPLRFKLIGDSDIDARRFPDVLHVTGPFSPEQLPALVAESGAHIGFLPSIWPETYSYVLSEYLKFNLFPVVFDIGAQAERVRQLGVGVIVPLGTSGSVINDLLLTLPLSSKTEPQPRTDSREYIQKCYGLEWPAEPKVSYRLQS